MLLASAEPRSTTLLPALLALLLLAPTAVAQPAPAEPTGSAAPAESLEKVISKEYELYGPTVEGVRDASSQIKGAFNQFVGYIGDRPDKIAFVLFRSAEDAARFDSKPFARRRMPIVPWLLPPGHPAPAPPSDDPNPYTLAHHAGHVYLLAYVAHVQAAMGKAGAGGTDAATAAGAITLPVPRHPDAPALPDWLEEAVAAHCEGNVLQRNRLEFMRSHLEKRIPFTELLVMHRPGAAGSDPGKSGKSGGSSAGSKSGAAKGAGGTQAAGTEREAIFCAEAFSLASFISQREQERFIGMIVEGVLRGRTVGDILNLSQDIRSKPEALEKQWLEWMQGAERRP